MTTDKPAPLLPGFIAELKSFCKARRGRINDLAAALQTQQQTVSAWLNGHQEPGGEAVLQLMAWLDRAKAGEAAEVVAADKALREIISRRTPPPTA